MRKLVVAHFNERILTATFAIAHSYAHFIRFAVRFALRIASGSSGKKATPYSIMAIIIMRKLVAAHFNERILTTKSFQTMRSLYHTSPNQAKRLSPASP